MKSKIKKVANISIPFSLSVIFIGFFLLICLLSVNSIFNNRQINQDNQISTVSSLKSSSSIPEQKINPSKKPTPKNSTSSAKTQSAATYHPVANGSELRVPILYYHYIGNNPNPADLQRNALSISPDKFEEQMKYLRDNGYTAISLDTLVAALRKKATLPSKPVILTFDDGYIDFYYNAYPVIRSYGMSATVFVITGFVGQKAYLTWPQIQEMHGSGVINFGAHTVHHYHLTSLSLEAAKFEIEESKKVLQEKLGVPINFMAYPNGSTNNLIIGLTQAAGYIGAVGTWPGKIQSEGTIYNIPRIRISGSINLATFISLL